MVRSRRGGMLLCCCFQSNLYLLLGSQVHLCIYRQIFGEYCSIFSTQYNPLHFYILPKITMQSIKVRRAVHVRINDFGTCIGSEMQISTIESPQSSISFSCQHATVTICNQSNIAGTLLVPNSILNVFAFIKHST